MAVPTPVVAVVVALLAATVLVGCGGDSDDGDGFAAVVVDVLSQQASVDGRRAAGGDRIRAGGLLATDDSGAARFNMRNDPTDCELRPASAVEVLPSPDLLLRITRGTAVCDRSGAGAAGTFAAPGSTMKVKDSVVLVKADGVVNQGPDDVEMRLTESNETATVRKEEEAIRRGARLIKRPSRLDREDQEAVGRVKADGGTSTSTTSKAGSTSTTTRPKTTSTSGPTTTRRNG